MVFWLLFTAFLALSIHDVYLQYGFGYAFWRAVDVFCFCFMDYMCNFGKSAAESTAQQRYMTMSGWSNASTSWFARKLRPCLGLIETDHSYKAAKSDTGRNTNSLEVLLPSLLPIDRAPIIARLNALIEKYK